MIEKDGWKLSIRAEFVPSEPDYKEYCPDCRKSGKFSIAACDEDVTCPYCGGLGFRYTAHQRGEKPEVDIELIKLLKEAYQKWVSTL